MSTKKRRRPGQIRVGDRVRIVNPVFVERVGYPKAMADYVAEIEQKISDRRLLDAFGDVFGHPWLGARTRRAFDKIRRELAYLVAQRDGFGGNERSLHVVTHPDLTGCMAYVEGLETVVTGTYSRGYDGGCYSDPEPPALERQVRHRLANVSILSMRPVLVDPRKCQRIDVKNLTLADAVRPNLQLAP